MSFSSSPSKFKHIGKVLTRKEKFFLYLAVFVFLGSLIAWAFYFYFSSTQQAPDFGGEYTEGLVGQPLYVNPILAQSNETDSILSHLIFSSLMTYDHEGNLVEDLTEKYEIQDEGKRYKFKIKEGAKWHDKTELTANDILFTVKLIQDPAFKSPLRGDWQNIQVSLEDDYTVAFDLAESHAPFLNKLTFGILPQHIYEEIPAEKFLLTKLNLEPVGSGPFEYSESKKDSEDNLISYQLLANPEYYDRPAYLEKITLNFYSSEDELFDAYSKKKINGFGVHSYEKANDLSARRDTRVHAMQLSRYFAIFFNQTKSVPLAKKDVREALRYGTNREEILEQVFQGYASEEVSPMLSSFGQFESKLTRDDYPYDPGKAEEMLDQAGWKKSDDGIRKKDGEVLEVAVVTTKWSALTKTAELLKKQWEQVGVRLNITTLEPVNFQQNFIKPREYQSVLFGQEYFGNDPDPYYFWHSEHKKDPGRNIALYDNTEVDKLLVDARKEQDLEKRKEKYAEFEKKVTADAPAIFLYRPYYVFITNAKIKGIDMIAVVSPAHRFATAKDWFVKTTRVKKD